MTNRQRIVTIMLALVAGVLVWQFARVQRAATIVPDALDKHGFKLTWDYMIDSTRHRRYHSDAPIKQVKSAFIRQMTNAGWDADERAGDGELVIYFGKGHYSKGMVYGGTDGKHGTWFDLHDHLSLEGRIKSMFGLYH